MTSIFEYKDHRSFLKAWLQSQPARGRGLLRVWAESLRVHPSYLSQILAGTKELNLEIAERMAQELRLNESETDYFLVLVEHSRAGTDSLRKHWKKKIEQAQSRSQLISERLANTSSLDDLARAEFYSSSLYSGIRNLCAIPKIHNSDDVARHLNLPKSVVDQIIEFLIRHGLVRLTPAGFEVTVKRTHLPADSPLVPKHHGNWRLEGLEQLKKKREDDLFFSFPHSLSRSDAAVLKKRLLQIISESHQIITNSPSETVRCLNIDYFSY